VTATDAVVERELDLLSPAVRADRARLEQLLHPEFVEIGASGRRWTRAEIVDALVATPGVDDLRVADVHARALGPDVVLVTYTTRRRGSAVHRSSIWVRRGADWVARFHQGTPAPDDA
jgi:hypothetical protein